MKMKFHYICVYTNSYCAYQQNQTGLSFPAVQILVQDTAKRCQSIVLVTQQ